MAAVAAGRGGCVMTRSKKASHDEVGDRLEAEDRAFDYLVKNFAPETSIATAIRVEFIFATRWEKEQADMMRRRGRSRRVFAISPLELTDIRRLSATVPPSKSDVAAQQRVVEMLTRFPVDQAWWIAHKVRTGVESWCGGLLSEKRPENGLPRNRGQTS